MFLNLVCTTIINGKVLPRTENSISVTAVLPAINVQRVYEDLRHFTPASAPALAPTAIASYESSVARSAAAYFSAIARTTITLHLAKSTQDPGQTLSPPPGLSVGDKTGIGLGVGTAVLLLIILGLFLLRRRRARHAPGQREESGRAFVDSKAELEDVYADKQGKAAAELPDREPQDMENASFKPFPSELASGDSRGYSGRSELDSGFAGHEVSDAARSHVAGNE